MQTHMSPVDPPPLLPPENFLDMRNDSPTAIATATKNDYYVSAFFYSSIFWLDSSIAS